MFYVYVEDDDDAEPGKERRPMHVIVVWERRGSMPPGKADDVTPELRACLEDYEFVTPFARTALYLVKVADETERSALRDSLLDVCRTHVGKIHLLVGPLQSAGGYNGWLPKSRWTELKAHTDS